MNNAERLAEAREMRKLVVEAIKALTAKRAKSWTVGGQVFTSVDIAELLKLLKYWESVIANCTGGQRVIRRIVPIND